MVSYSEALENLFPKFLQLEQDLHRRGIRRSRRKKMEQLRSLMVDKILLIIRLMLLEHNVIVDADFNQINQ